MSDNGKLIPRDAFEEWISSPPFECEVERFGDGSAWPGSYRDINVELAWCAWIDAMAITRDRCAKIVEEVQGWEGVKDVADRIRGFDNRRK